MNEKILNVVKELKEKSEKRNFSQTFDLIISLKELDMKKPESKINEDFPLPHGRGEEAKVVVFSDTQKITDAEVLTTADVDQLATNKRQAKKIAQQTHFFLAEAKLMPLVGKVLGQSLGPKGKVPKLLVGNIAELVKNAKRAVKIRTKDSPVIQCLVGNDKMPDEHVAENIEAVLKFLEHKLPKGKTNIGKVLLKLTMSKPIKVEV